MNLYTEFKRVNVCQFFRSFRSFPDLGMQVIVPSKISSGRVPFAKDLLNTLKIQNLNSFLK